MNNIKAIYPSEEDPKISILRHIIFDIVKERTNNILELKEYIKKVTKLRDDVIKELPEDTEIFIDKKICTYTEAYLNVKDILKELNLEDEISNIDRKIKELQKTAEEKTFDIRNTINTLSSLLINGVPSIEWMIESIIRKGGITVFGGAAGSMKSWFAMYISVCLSQEVKILNQFDVKKSNILYIDEENGDIVMLNRFMSLIKGMKIEPSALNNIHLSVFNNFKLDNEEVIGKLEYIIKNHQPDLIIFDSMVRCMEGEEDKSKDVRLIFDHLKEIFNKHGTSFVLLHHTAKHMKGLNALRGSGDFAGMADIVMMFDRLQDGSIKVSFEKNRHIDTQKLQNFNFRPIHNEKTNSFNFEFLGYNTESVTKRDQCMKHLLEFAKDKGSIGFKKNEAIQELTPLEYSKTMVYEVIQLGISSGLFEVSGKMLYFKDQMILGIDEETINY